MTSPTLAAKTEPPHADRLRAAGISVTILLVLAGTAAQLVNYGFDLGVAVLDSSGDGGAFGMVGDIALASAAFSAWNRLARVRPPHLASVALPLLVTFLAVDKALRLHDDIANWRLYYAPVLLATLVALVVIGQRLSARNLLLMRVGFVLLVVAFVIHLTAKYALGSLRVSEDSWPSQITGITKHSAEVAGWLMVALAIALGVRERTTVRPRSTASPTSRATA